MKFYTYADWNRLERARIVQTRDARTVNPGENKLDPENLSPFRESIPL